MNPLYTFETFIVSPANQFAYHAARSVAENPGIYYNPLVLYGATGCGKTHLMHAIGNEMIEREPAMKVWYLSARELADELVASVREVMDRIKHLNALLIEDVQFIHGKPYIQAQFFDIITYIYENNRQVVISCNKWPGEMPDIKYLIKKFKKNLIADIQPPKIEVVVWS